MPPFSAIESEDSASVVCGASLSVMVSVRADGCATPLPPAAVPDTVTCLLPVAVVSSLAVTVTTPALTVEPAAMVKAVAVLRLKSPDAARIPAAA